MMGDDWYSFGLASLEQEVERMIRSFFSEFRDSLAMRRGQPYPVVDIYETKDQLRIMVELGGMGPEEVEVSVTSDMVIIEGDKKEDDAGSERRSYICLEREFGPFRRVIEIPGPVDTGQVKATIREGVLCIIFPKIVDRRMRKRKVPIEVQD